MLMHALASSFLNYPLIHVSLIIFKLRKNKNFQFSQFVAVIGTAFALNILFHISIWTGVLITGLSSHYWFKYSLTSWPTEIRGNLFYYLFKIFCSINFLLRNLIVCLIFMLNYISTYFV